MGYSIAEKIIKNHIRSGILKKGEEISIKIDQTLTQDSTGTMAYLQFEAIGVDRVKTKRSVAYIDHNTLQTGPENADDHLYIQSVAKKYGILFSKAGNGICHQVNLERFAAPGETLLGSDSHTPTAGGIGMLAIGAGGLDVAVAMGGGAYYLKMPQIVKVNLTGKLKFPSASKDIIFELLKRLSVKGGVNKIFEYSGEGVLSLSVPERATITNMGAELGATTSIFPSDIRTLEFLSAQNRGKDFKEISADDDAIYDDYIDINLDELEPYAACPHNPDSVVKVSKLKDIKVNQVAIGSCTNSSYTDLMKCVQILKGKKVNENVSLVIAPGSRQVYEMLSQNGGLSELVNAGARILECACGPCIGMGQSPSSDGVSLRTFNRNFEGRSGTKSAKVYLVSPEVAAASALTGYITIPEINEINVNIPNKFAINDNMIIEPAPAGEDIKVIRGPNIKPFPRGKAVEKEVSGTVLIKLTDNITTDHIMPSNSKLLPYRSNIPYLSDYCLSPCDERFPSNAKENAGGFIVAGDNYGQGSSREHAALVPLFLGIKAVLAKSFARIHRANLINNGILPLVFKNTEDYDSIEKEDMLVIKDTLNNIRDGYVTVNNLSKSKSYIMIIDACEREKNMLVCGGLLNYTKQNVRGN